MDLDYATIEKDFDCACQDVIKDLTLRYKNDFHDGGPGKLEAFLELIRLSFEKAETQFVEKNKLGTDNEALRRIKQIAKKHARQCLEFYNKI